MTAIVDRYFLDTNVLLYAISLDPAERPKRDCAQYLIDTDGANLSVQVLQEFIAQAMKPKRLPALSMNDAWEIVGLWRRFPIQENTLALLDSARTIHNAHRFSFWDCLIVAAANALGCPILYTEDMDDGRIVDGLRIVNPFREGAVLP